MKISPIYNLIQELIRSLNLKLSTVTNELLCYQQSKIYIAKEEKDNPIYLPVGIFYISPSLKAIT